MREVLRVQMNLRLHPLGDMIFDPTARPGYPDWRVMYLERFNGGSNQRFRSVPKCRRETSVVGRYG